MAEPESKFLREVDDEKINAALGRIKNDLDLVTRMFHESIDPIHCVAQGRLEAALWAVDETRNLLYGE